MEWYGRGEGTLYVGGWVTHGLAWICRPGARDTRSILSFPCGQPNVLVAHVIVSLLDILEHVTWYLHFENKKHGNIEQRQTTLVARRFVAYELPDLISRDARLCRDELCRDQVSQTEDMRCRLVLALLPSSTHTWKQPLVDLSNHPSSLTT